jgi:glycerol-3-phosphate dehydrogenase (NAD(P)+)
MSSQRITILGDGAMATVCAMLLDAKGQSVVMWGPFAQHVEQMQRSRRNDKYLPDVPLSESIELTADEAEAVAGTSLIVSAIPTQFVRSVWQRFAPHMPEGVPIVSVAKGIENDTLLRPTQTIADVLRSAGHERPTLAAISGPSIASELARCLPATVCVAGDEPFIKDVQRLFTTQWMRVYTNPDLLGLELAGATKNVIAIAAGIIDGLHAGYNAKSALLSRGLAEITRLGVAMGARPDTFFGIAGVGDLATTCFSPEGRNRTCGELLGRGIKLPDALKQINGVVEGVATTRSVIQIAKKYNVEMPIAEAVHDVLFEGMDPIHGISRLMSRQLKEERVG